MKLWIIYSEKQKQTPTNPTKYMFLSAKKNNLDAKLVFKEDFYFDKQKLYYKNKFVKVLPDVALFRTPADELMSFFERCGTKTINNMSSTLLAKDKWLTYNLVNQIEKIKQPKTLFVENQTYNKLKAELGSPFVLKNVQGSQGNEVFLIKNKNEFDKTKELLSGKISIAQTFIKSSFGKSLRVLAVKNKMYGALFYQPSKDEFRSNLHNGGQALWFELNKNIKTQTQKIMKKFNLEFAGLDFLFGENDDDFYFCEANSLAGFYGFFSLGLDIQDILMKHIIKEYSTYQNPKNIKMQIENSKQSFEVFEGNFPILISAPHNVSQIREGKHKHLDIGSGNLAIKLKNILDANLIIKSKCLGNQKFDDDANYEITHPYKQKTEEIVNSKKIKALLDIHSLKPERSQFVNLGINGGKNIQNNFELLNKITLIFERSKFPVSIDHPFCAPEHTVCGSLASKTNVFCLQIEINSKLINPKNKENKIKDFCTCLEKVAKLIDKEL